MKSEKGVTLTALVIYIGVAMIVIGMMAVVSSFFFSNMNLIKDQEKYAVEFNKFNMFFINDVKRNNTAQIADEMITMEDGTTYRYLASEKAIYRNETKIANEIQALKFTEDAYEVPNTSTTKKLIHVYMRIGKNNDYEKTIEYTFKYW